MSADAVSKAKQTDAHRIFIPLNEASRPGGTT